MIVTGDHGEGLGEHGETSHSYFIYQSTLHVPLVIRVPDCNKGIQVEGDVSLVDIVPTVLDLLGLKLPNPLDGVGLRPVLEGGPAAERPLYSESLLPATFDCSALHGVVEGRWKYILAPHPELYNLTEDPGELTNLAAKKPDVVKQLHARLAAMAKKFAAAPPRRAQSSRDRENPKSPRILGYVDGGAEPSASIMETTGEDPKDFISIFERFVAARVELFEEVGHRREAEKHFQEIAAEHPLIEVYRMLAQIAVGDGRPAATVGYCRQILDILGKLKDPAKQRADGLRELAEGAVQPCTRPVRLARRFRGDGALPEGP